MPRRNGDTANRHHHRPCNYGRYGLGLDENHSHLGQEIKLQIGLDTPAFFALKCLHQLGDWPQERRRKNVTLRKRSQRRSLLRRSLRSGLRFFRRGGLGRPSVRGLGKLENGSSFFLSFPTAAVNVPRGTPRPTP